MPADAILTRLDSSDQGMFGRIVGPGIALFTGELPWRENQPSISCIPEGIYRVAWTFSPRFKRFMYLVGEVVARSGIRKHPANLMGDAALGYKSQLNGCIALGERLGWLDLHIESGGSLAALNSTSWPVPASGVDQLRIRNFSGAAKTLTAGTGWTMVTADGNPVTGGSYSIPDDRAVEVTLDPDGFAQVVPWGGEVTQAEFTAGLAGKSATTHAHTKMGTSCIQKNRSDKYKWNLYKWDSGYNGSQCRRYYWSIHSPDCCNPCSQFWNLLEWRFCRNCSIPNCTFRYRTPEGRRLSRPQIRIARKPRCRPPIQNERATGRQLADIRRPSCCYRGRTDCRPGVRDLDRPVDGEILTCPSQNKATRLGLDNFHCNLIGVKK